MKDEIRECVPPILGLGNDWTIFEYEMKKRFDGVNPEKYNLPVSIVIPVYNRRDKLSKTIAALTHQTYPLELMEVIIADDGSSDHPETVIDDFSSYFSMSYINQEDEGYRLSEIRNKGIEASTNEQIIILDCDMLPLSTLVESYMKYAHVSDKAVLIGGRRYINTDSISAQDIIQDINCATSLPSLRTDTGQIPKNGLPPSEDWRYKIYRNTNNLKNSKYPFRAFCGGNVCFHKSLISEIGGFDEDFTAWGAEDTEFGFRIYNKGYWLIPVDGAEALHQEPPNGSNETDRGAGKSITQPILIEKCPAFYRKMEKNRIYEIPKLSIYIPAYNAIQYIEEAIESALNQTYTDLEVVIVNDGSTDGTGEFLDEIYSNNPRIKIIHQENKGISFASNVAINNCKGEYVLQLDSDDALLPEAAEMLTPIVDTLAKGGLTQTQIMAEAEKTFMTLNKEVLGLAKLTGRDRREMLRQLDEVRGDDVFQSVLTSLGDQLGQNATGAMDKVVANFASLGPQSDFLLSTFKNSERKLSISSYLPFLSTCQKVQPLQDSLPCIFALI